MKETNRRNARANESENYANEFEKESSNPRQLRRLTTLLTTNLVVIITMILIIFFPAEREKYPALVY